MSNYTHTNIALTGCPDPVVVDQTVGEITSYDLLDDHGFLHLSFNDRPILIQINQISVMVGTNDGGLS